MKGLGTLYIQVKVRWIFYHLFLGMGSPNQTLKVIISEIYLAPFFYHVVLLLPNQREFIELLSDLEMQQVCYPILDLCSQLVIVTSELISQVEFTLFPPWTNVKWTKPVSIVLENDIF